METITNLIQQSLGISPELQGKLLNTLVIIIVWMILDRLIKKIIFDKIDDLTFRYQWQKIVKYLTVLVVIILLTKVWFGAFESIGTYFGLLSAGLAIALQDLLVNFAGWIFLIGVFNS